MKNFYATKWWTIMKMGATQIIMVTLFFGVTMAHDNYGQLLDRKVSISINNASMHKALDQLEQAGEVKFAYSRELLDMDEIVSLKAEHKQLREILNELLIPRGINYIIYPNTKLISLTRIDSMEGDAQDIKNPDKEKEEPTRTLITGIVSDVNKQPLAGVNILVKGTALGTTTDPSGAYTINAEADDVLVYSFIGFASAEMRVGEQTRMDIILTEDVRGLNEVIVNAGYWEVKEKEQTGSSTRVTSAQIEKQPVSNPLQALQGRMTGVYIQQNTGMPGGGFSIQVRGQNSLRNGINGGVNGNLPLYLVDGVPFTTSSLTSSIISNGNIVGGNPLSTINPNDIENIEVLKDADATAIYGARGANGVVLITTKRAKSGKAKIDLDVYQGIGQVANKMNLLNTTGYLAMRKEAYRNDKLQPNVIDAPDLLVWDTTRNTNWQKELIGGKAHVTNAQVNFSAGSQQTQILFGGAYYRESTVMPGSNTYQRGSGRLSVNHSSFSNRLKISSTVNYSASVNQLPSIDLTSIAVTLAPDAPALYDENGELNWQQNTWANPLSNLKRTYKGNIENLVSNASIGYEILSGLILKSTLGYTSMQVTEVNNNPLSAYSPTDVTGRTASSYFGNSKIRTWIVEPQVDYSRSIAKGVLSALVGLTFQESMQSGQTIEGAGYTNDAFLGNMAAAPQINIIDNSSSHTGTAPSLEESITTGKRSTL